MTFTLVAGTGFEHGSTGVFTSGGGSVSGSYKKNGNYGMYLPNDSSALIDGIISANEAYASFWIYTNNGWDGIYCRFKLSDNNYVGIRWGYGGNPNYYRWRGVNNTTEFAVGSIDHWTQVWHHIQIHLIVGDSGTLQIKIDGVLDIDYSGDTKPGTSETITGFYWGGNINANYFLDDIAIGTGGWPGDIRYEAIVPTADTATDQWTPSTGSDAWEMVNEVPYSDTDYISTTTSGHRTLMDLGDFTGTNKEIVAVINWVRAWKSDAISDQLKLLLKSGSTEVNEIFDLLTTVAYKYKIYNTNPDDSAAWEDADIDALQIGVESIIV